MIYSELINKVIKFAYDAHHGQIDKAGVPYFCHPFHVAEQMNTEEEVIVALLHDVLEDTDKTETEILSVGVTEKQLEAIKLLTRKDGVSYFEYVENLKLNPIAKRVKMADLAHNSDLSRTVNPTERDFKRIEKYKKAKEILPTWEMKLIPEAFNKIVSGEKKIELRLNDEKRRAIFVGDKIVFTNTTDENKKLVAEVVALHRFESFESIFRTELFSLCGFGNLVVEKAIEKMRNFYTESDEYKYGIVGIELLITN